MDKLHEILAHTRRRLKDSKNQTRAHELEKLAIKHKPRGFRRALLERSLMGTALIAELKKASPSQGLIRPDFDVEALAAEFEKAGATALSVLTESDYFQGSLENLVLASSATNLPCLRKDFIIDEYQVVESRAFGADAILLIVAALEDRELRHLHDCADHYGLDVLCEVHERDEMKRAADLGFNLIGVNNRDLHSLHVDMENSLRFPEDFPPHAVRVAESGIDSRATLERLRAAGYQAFLVGERLMRAASPGEVLRELAG